MLEEQRKQEELEEKRKRIYSNSKVKIVIGPYTNAAALREIQKFAEQEDLDQEDFYEEGEGEEEENMNAEEEGLNGEEEEGNNAEDENNPMGNTNEQSQKLAKISEDSKTPEKMENNQEDNQDEIHKEEQKSELNQGNSQIQNQDLKESVNKSDEPQFDDDFDI